MTATHHKLNIVWKVVRFTIAVRPARSVAQMINRHTAGGSPANGRALTELSTRETDDLPDDAAHRWRSSHVVNLHIA